MRLPSSFAVIGLLLSSHALSANPLQKEPSDRVQREAKNPMRVIMEAAQLKRGARTPESAPSPPQALTARPKSAISPVTTVTVITAPAKSKPLPPPVTAIAPEVDTLGAPVAPIEAAASSPKAPELSASAVPPQPVAAATGVTPPVPIRLVYRTDPVLPEHLQREMPQDTEVRVKLDIDPQGAVYRVEVLSKVVVGLEPVIQSALRRWRFEPMADRATAQVTLVFRTEE